MYKHCYQRQVFSWYLWWSQSKFIVYNPIKYFFFVVSIVDIVKYYTPRMETIPIIVNKCLTDKRKKIVNGSQFGQQTELLSSPCFNRLNIKNK